jgi:hypothetical protein
MVNRLQPQASRSCCVGSQKIFRRTVAFLEPRDGLLNECKRQWSDRLDLLERWLVESRATVIIPLDDRVVFVSSLNCADFSSWFSEVS